jgi:hypothetical protein
MSDKNSSKLQDSDILTFYSGYEYIYKYKNFAPTFKNFLQDGRITESMRTTNPPIIVGSSKWLDGIDCQLLRNGVEQKGKIKVTLEFVPNEIEVIPDLMDSSDEKSPLDDIRQINL